jgi:hypothetical protein
MEIFKQITGYEKYSISNLGRVLNNKTERILKTGLDSGYFVVGLYKDGKAKIFKVHRLVGMAFIENIDNKNCIDHKNNITTDNRAENLRWATHAENMQNAKIRKDNTSGIKGVYFNKGKNKWTAQIRIDGQRIYIGSYITSEEATTARRRMALSVFGEFLNDSEK